MEVDGGGHGPEPWGIQILRGWEEGKNSRKKLKRYRTEDKNWKERLSRSRARSAVSNTANAKRTEK